MENNQIFINVRRYARVIIIGAILSATFFLISLATFKTYESTVTILVTAKSPLAAAQQEKIVGNLAAFPRTLAFYDRLLKYNPDVRDIAAGSSSSQRRQIWNDMLKVSQPKEHSSIIAITLFAVNKTDADQLATKTARNLFDTASFYYNIKTDIDMRLIDGPISRPVVHAWGWLLMLSILLGSALATIIENGAKGMWETVSTRSQTFNKESLANFSQKIFSTKKTDEAVETQIEQAEPAAESNIPEETENIPEVSKEEVLTPEQVLYNKELEQLNKIIQQDIYPNFPEMPVHGAPKASAPDNLPIGDDSFYAPVSASAPENLPTEQPAVGPTKVEEEKTHEPTAQELKDRLNKLLKGEL